jgi:predicted nucleic acid-binding protein
MFLLDTNVLSELRRPERASSQVVAWAREIDPGDMFISVISLLELDAGALLVGRRDPTQETVLRRWIEGTVIPAFANRILPVDLAVARRCSPLHVPDKRPERDALIGATALTHRLTVATRNIRDFEPMGVPLVDPWTYH